MISGPFAFGLVYYRYIKKQRLLQPQYNIVAILQTTSDKEKLKTVYLAELLKLSVDQPTNLFRFNTKEAQKILLSSPLITFARVKKIPPGTIYIDYTLRKPIAYLTDISNTVVDREGVAFPFKPFFTPKKLPEIFLGLSEPIFWGKPVKDIKFKLALYLIDLINENLSKEGLTLLKVDVSKALSDSYGQREVVVTLEDSIEKKNEDGKRERSIISHLLRLNVDHYRQGLADYLQWRNHQIQQGCCQSFVIDLRVPELAFIQTDTKETK